MAFDENTMFTSSISGFVVDLGEYSFVTTGTTVEIPTRLSVCYASYVMSKVTMTSGIEIFFSDKIITNGAITVSRLAQTDTGGSPGYTSGLTISYMFIGV